MKETLVLVCVVSMCAAKTGKTPQWPPKGHPDIRTCSNLTQVLDNWKFAILYQVKELLINDHASVLPEYNRIQPLSEALSDLYRQFNNLKEELGRFGAKFDRMEAFVDELRLKKFTPAKRPLLKVLPRVGPRYPLLAQLRNPDRVLMTRPAQRRGHKKPVRLQQ